MLFRGFVSLRSVAKTNRGVLAAHVRATGVALAVVCLFALFRHARDGPWAAHRDNSIVCLVAGHSKQASYGELWQIVQKGRVGSLCDGGGELVGLA